MFLWINLREIAPMDLFMRKHLYFLSYLLILNPFILFANEPISLKKLEENNNIFIIKGTQKPYTGIINEFYKNKKIKYTGNFENGKKTGEWKYFEETGTMWLSETYKDGKKFGEYIRFHINGVPWKKGRYVNNKKNGEWDFFSIDGKILEEGNYLEDQKNGIWSK